MLRFTEAHIGGHILAHFHLRVRAHTTGASFGVPRQHALGDAEALSDEIFNPEGNESTYPYEAFGYLSDNHLRARYNTDAALTQKIAAKTVRDRYKSRNSSLDLDYSKG